MNYLIYGLEKSGLASIELLKGKNNTLFLYDDNTEKISQVKSKFNYNNLIFLTKLDVNLLKKIDCVVVSPSISKYNNFIKLAKQNKVEIISEIELASRFFKGRLVAITGTNGKTTTVELLYHILKTAKKDVKKVGNIGIPFSREVLNSTKRSIFVCEVSSFQLENISSFHANISALVNVTNDHLDRYDDFEDYKQTKFKIFQNQTKKDYAILSKEIYCDRISSKVYKFNDEKSYGCYIKNNNIYFKSKLKISKICNINTIKYTEKHNLDNICCAVTIAKILKVKNKDIQKALHTFCMPSHRLQVVKEINNIRFIDDSKATNVDASIKAIKSLENKNNFILILGGSDKGFNYDEIFYNVPNNLKKIIAMGDVANKIRQSKINTKSVVPLEICKTLKEAVYLSCMDLVCGDTLLLSPASASYNEFKDYAERGRFFKQYIEDFYGKKA